MSKLRFREVWNKIRGIVPQDLNYLAKKGLGVESFSETINGKRHRFYSVDMELLKQMYFLHTQYNLRWEDAYTRAQVMLSSKRDSKEGIDEQLISGSIISYNIGRCKAYVNTNNPLDILSLRTSYLLSLMKLLMEEVSVSTTNYLHARVTNMRGSLDGRKIKVEAQENYGTKSHGNFRAKVTVTAYDEKNPIARITFYPKELELGGLLFLRCETKGSEGAYIASKIMEALANVDETDILEILRRSEKPVEQANPLMASRKIPKYRYRHKRN